MDFKIIILFVMTTVYIGLWFLIYFKGEDRALSRNFSIFVMNMAIWTYGLAMFYYSNTIFANLFWTKIVYIAGSLIPSSFLLFSFIFPEGEFKISRAQQCAIFVPNILFVFLFFLTPFMVKEVSIINGSKGFIYGQGHFLWDIQFNVFFGWAFWRFTKMYKISIGIIRLRLRYILLGTLTGVILAGTTNVVMPWFHRFELLWLGPPLTLTWLMCVGYAIFKYRLIDIKIAMSRTGIFISVYALVLGLPFGIGAITKSWFVATAVATVLASIGPFIYQHLKRKTEDILLKEQRRYQDTLKRASLGMTRVRDISKLLKLIVYTVAKAVRLNHAAIYILNKEADGYILGSSRGSLNPTQTQTISLNTPLIQHLLGSEGPLLLEELTHNPTSPEREPRPDARLPDRQVSSGRGEYQNNLLKAQLYTLSASVVIPSFIEDDLLGFMVLGEKRSGSIYTEDDLRVFTVLASQAGLAIENARFFESAKETQEQIAQAEKMATLGTMADGLSHQMNNRFHAMSLIASDALDCIKSSDNKNSSPEIKELLSYLEHSAQRIKSNSLQGGDIVRGMLKYTRKGETGFAGVNLDELLNATLEMLQFKIKLSEIDIERNYPKEETNLKANFTQLQEVFFNLIDNAYDAMNERKAALKEPGYRGKVKIVAIPDPANRVTKIIVHDNGLGIKEEDQKKVFTPFFTTKISNRKGTGLGLYVIKKIITENHKGRIQVSSIYKQGTTFSLELTTADMAEHAHNAPTKGNIEIWGE